MPDVTISLTAGQATRVQAALATAENPAPNISDAKEWLIRQLRARVRQYEDRAAQQSLPQPDPFEPT
jgi:hypothetical protein